MRYPGSKRAIAKHILPVMLAARYPGQTWVEPFVGGGNLIWRVGGPRIGNDVQPELIALLSSVRDGWEPPTEVSRAFWSELKANPQAYPPELVAFAGTCCSFGGRWFETYASSKDGRNYALESAKSLRKQAPGLTGVQFYAGDYQALPIPPRSLVYCDPPYADTHGYRDVDFDHERFWEWCRGLKREGHTVFVSEYRAPSDFVCILEVPTRTQICRDQIGRHPRTERLFQPR